MRLSDRSGASVQLGKELARGGEGTIFLVSGRDDVVAKVYHDAPGSSRIAKLSALVELSRPVLLRTAAWPIDILRESKRGTVVGFLMPKASDHHDLHVLYGPKTRLRTFPDAGWSFLVRAATNLARAFDAVHSEGHVIGDVNDRIALVSGQAIVRLVDCDSFQVRHAGQLYTCDVGIPIFQPPELQGLKSFRGVERTPNHDRFGLAVLIFQLLFLARHPFSGTFLGDGDMSIERGIAEGRFVYGTGAARVKMRAPPNSLDLAVVDDRLANLFERAFSPDASTTGRPVAADWVSGLVAFEATLMRCGRNPSHTFARRAAGCPLCAIETRVGIALFGFPSSSTKPSTVDVSKLWAAIERIAPPQAAAPLSLSSQQKSPPLSPIGWRVRRARIRAALLRGLLVVFGCASIASCMFAHGWIGTIGLVLVGIMWGQIGSKKHGAVLEAEQALAAAESNARELERRWNAEATESRFDEVRNELARARDEIGQLSVHRAKRIAVLERERRQQQLDDFLEAYRLARAEIKGIGVTRKATLESYGIETAADITTSAVEAVPGFGPALTKTLVQWRLSIERKFVFDPKKGVDPRRIAQLDRELELRRSELVRSLSEGAARLEKIKADIANSRSLIAQALPRVTQGLVQARRDLGT